LEGTLKTKGRVIIGVEGLIKGTVEAENADVEGKFSGQLSVANILTIKATSAISGDVITGKLSIEPGATFNATCTMKGTLKELKKGNETKKNSEKTA
jgi:cytoskeletal protein CcmA (bactofilin family)